ncbi:MAG: pyrimidine 5'-nucleotidase [Hyphomicrobiaceae bacterium]|nr:pyrimidine 5'-nucleotidase [Hyphomicrobiaceae bacterium]MCC0009510.1 pyrimidine 5'-nucleotidase [Hyphomicrobiaceae bacterium]
MPPKHNDVETEQTAKPDSGSEAQKILNRPGFDSTRVWVFDLDNTLYPADCNLFAQVDHRMGEFIQNYLGVSYDYARHLQKSYYRQFGTTLAGLMQIHKLEPSAFLDYVHDIDLSPVPEHPDLAAAIEKLPGRKLIFTAGSRRHAENVAGKLGILHLFEDICDIVATGFVPKEQREAYDHLIGAHGIKPQDAAMFEDMPHNLLAPHELGMTTVLVHSNYMDHPAQSKIKGWVQPPKHIHHMTDDLASFLSGLNTTK